MTPPHQESSFPEVRAMAIREEISPFLPAGFESDLSLEMGEVEGEDPFLWAPNEDVSSVQDVDGFLSALHRPCRRRQRG